MPDRSLVVAETPSVLFTRKLVYRMSAEEFLELLLAINHVLTTRNEYPARTEDPCALRDEPR